MSKVSTKISLDRADIEISKENGEYYIWLFSKSISEHVGVTLSHAEMLEFRAMLLGGIV